MSWCSAGNKKKLLEKNVFVYEFSGKLIDLRALLRKLAENNVCSVLVEGGGGVNAGFVEENLVDELVFFICPKIIGGKDAKTPVEGIGVRKVRLAKQLLFEKIERIGRDLVVYAKPVKRTW
ncbi:RibD family protein [Candidatus Micrarchaeota archaeon]|nr:RibD family protein [Candidatus Micrarchaeota archaeon]